MILRVVFLTACAVASAQTIVNRSDQKPGSDSVVLREDSRTGGMELIATYPGGHQFAPHSHRSNERIVLLEGKLSLQLKGAEKSLEPGGYAFLPAGEVQRMKCESQSRCVFYVSWDGDPKSVPAPE
jgi:quercetin dioxygenase-like cupin family protein